MSSQPALKLVTTRPAPDSFKLERRTAARRKATGSLTAVCISEAPDGDRRRRIARLTMRDISESGMGAFCSHELTPGTRVAMLIPPHGPDNGFDLFGKVVRCQPADGGYEIGVSLDQASSACA